MKITILQFGFNLLPWVPEPHNSNAEIEDKSGEAGDHLSEKNKKWL